MKATESQIDNLVSLLDGYAAKGGHHLICCKGRASSECECLHEGYAS